MRSIQPHIQALEIDRLNITLASQGDPPIRRAVMDYSILDLESGQSVRQLTVIHSAIVRLK